MAEAGLTPVPAALAHAAEEARYNNRFTENFVKDLSHEDWTRRPEGAANHVARTGVITGSRRP